MSNWWEQAPLIEEKAMPQAKWWEAAPLDNPAPVEEEAKPETPALPPRPDFRPGWTMAGGTAGMAAAAPLAMATGPLAPAVLLGGGVLGAAGGSLAHDVAQNAFRASGLSADAPTTTPSDQLKNAADAAKEEAIWSGGIMAAGPIIRQAGKPLVGRVLGLMTPEAKHATDLAHVQGIDVGAMHVSPRKAVRGTTNVLGIFPFVGTPIREGQARVVGQLDEAGADLLNTLAPASDRQSLSQALTKAAENRYGKFRTVASGLYKRFDDLAEALPDNKIVPTTPVREAVAQIRERAAKETVPLAYPIGAGETLKVPGSDQVGAFVEQLERLPNHLTVQQARGLQRQINELAATMAKDGYDTSRLSALAAATKSAIHSPDLSRVDPDSAAAVTNALDKANRFFATMSGRFESPTAQRFGRVDKHIFGHKFFRAGNLNEDEVFDAVFRAKSPDALSDLRDLVGPDKFKLAARSYLENAYRQSVIPAKEGSTIPDMFSAADFERRLGLDSPEGWKAMKEMLRGTMTTVDDWKNFLAAAKTATDIKIKDPSTFIARRAVLSGGVGGIVGGMALAGNQVSFPFAVLLTYAARKGASFLMNPANLRSMTRVAKDTASDHEKRSLIVRLLRPEQGEAAQEAPLLSLPGLSSSSPAAAQ